MILFRKEASEINAYFFRLSKSSFFLRPKPIDFFEFDYHANDYGLALFNHNTYVKKGVGEAKDMDAIADWMVESDEMDLINWDVVPNSTLVVKDAH